MKTGVGITQKLALVFTVFAAGLVLGVGLILYTNGRGALERGVESELESIANEKEAAVRSWLQERLMDLRVVSGASGVRQNLPILLGSGAEGEKTTAYRRLVEAIEANIGQGQDFISVLVMDPETGEVVASTDPGEEGDVHADRPFFLEGKSAPFIQSLYFSPVIRQPAITISAPITGEDGFLLGVIAGRLDLRKLQELINLPQGNRETLDAYIVTQSYLLATRPRFLDDPARMQQEIRSEAVEACVAGESGITQAPDFRAVPMVSAHHWLAGENLCLIVAMDQAEAFADTRSLAETIVLFGGAAVLIAALIATALARTITKPILRLQGATLRLAEGNWEYRVPEESTDELGLLARNFNRMAKTLSRNDAHLREQSRQLMEANEQLEAFSYSVSHDLRAPLRSIDGFARILSEDYPDKLDADGQRYVGIVRGAAQQMGKLIDDLLAFSHVSREDILAREIDIEKLVHEVATVSMAGNEYRRIDFEIGVLPPCFADPDLMRQAIQNLMANAVKYTRQRDVARIEVGTEPLDGETVYYIRDNGTGFNMKYVDKLFGVFQRLHRIEEFEGTGVGLAIVKRIINRHGGRIWAEAEVDRGATFFFTVPVRREPVEKPPMEAEISSLVARARDLV
jgi:signal transduction histidine kinase